MPKEPTTTKDNGTTVDTTTIPVYYEKSIQIAIWLPLRDKTEGEIG